MFEICFEGVLIQHGLRVTCEATSNFKSTLKKSYRSVSFLLNNWKETEQEVSRDRDLGERCLLILLLLEHQTQ